MSELLNFSGGTIGLERMKEIRKQTIKKWSELGFLDGLSGHVKENIAQLYEGQATCLINEDFPSDTRELLPISIRVASQMVKNDNMMKTTNEIIDDVLIKNNSHWCDEDKARYAIGEGRLPITRKDVLDIIQNLPIHIEEGINNTTIEIVDGVIIVKPTV